MNALKLISLVLCLVAIVGCLSVRVGTDVAIPTPALTSDGELCEIEENGEIISGKHDDFESHVRGLLNFLLEESEDEPDHQLIDYLRDCLGER